MSVEGTGGERLDWDLGPGAQERLPARDPAALRAELERLRAENARLRAALHELIEARAADARRKQLPCTELEALRIWLRDGE